MTTLASILSIASGFALMGYHEPPANMIATSIIINLALTPLTAIVASRRGRSALRWTIAGLALGAWALAAVMIIPAPSRPAPPRPDAPHVSAYFSCCLIHAAVGAKTWLSDFVPANTSRWPQLSSLVNDGSGAPVDFDAASTWPGQFAPKLVLANAITGIFDALSDASSSGVNGFSPSCTDGQ